MNTKELLITDKDDRPQFTPLPKALLERIPPKLLGLVEKVVYSVMLNRYAFYAAQAPNGVLRETSEILCRRCGVTRRQLQTAIINLIHIGLVTDLTPGLRNRPHCYVVHDWAVREDLLTEQSASEASKEKLLFQSTAQIDSTTAQIDSTTAQIDSTTAQIDSTTAQIDSTGCADLCKSKNVLEHTNNILRTSLEPSPEEEEEEVTIEDDPAFDVSVSSVSPLPSVPTVSSDTGVSSSLNGGGGKYEIDPDKEREFIERRNREKELEEYGDPF